ncbi:hypothetical protein G3O08_11430 [Cryomorpha ignava]|uniref:Glycosyltransferase RgtA/B/C/D-like domain-containing protein n=1 Tax=Cryomorpha ignava TaxID=101383 RepID=A0A7K3WTB0_9FLAO|nr:glycosyltransferase family 39 protein [Cryomorpha ignava]NEN24112.1 hypothetical protein [Cryomorpha ignava]
MPFSFFSDTQVLPLYPAVVILLLSVILFHSNKNRAAIITLFLGILVMGFFMANLDPFLVLWDEQYHALVAKNLAVNPLKPVLYRDPVLPYYFADWTKNYIWLHKQPLFLWQMALSIKLFGANELAVRIPSILLHALTSVAIYRIGELSINRRTGFYGALFFGLAYYQLEHVAGRFTTDHNDVAFLFYVTASFWAWFEYQRSKKGVCLILIGIFSGGAVLIKWLVGLIIYAVWFFTIGVSNRSNWLSPNAYKPILKSAVISLAVFLPWQIFVHYKYPVEAAFEMNLNTDHFFNVVESHGGDIWFHFRAIYDIYGSGDLIPFLIVGGLILLLIKTKEATHRIAFISFTLIVYGFYSLAATKMTSFTILVSPIIYLGFGTLINSLFTWLDALTKKARIVSILRICAVIGFGFMCLNLSKIEKNHSMKKPLDNFGRERELAQIEFYNAAKNLLGNQNYIVFNADVGVNGNIAFMFYTDYTAYGRIPTQSEIDEVKSKHYKIAIRDDGSLPDYIIADTTVVKIPGANSW